jgi:alkylhydroperoxidase/carboxymuconolactone decarboxylase family protein YurZ
VAAAHDAGPLDERTRRLVKLAIAIGARLEGAVRSHTWQAKEAGLSEADRALVSPLGEARIS